MPFRSSMTAMAPGASQPPSAAEASARSARPWPYGGSRKASVEPPFLPAGPRSVASRRKILVTPVSPSASTLRRMSARASRLLLDEQAEGGAPRQRLEAERAGAGEQVEHPGALELEVGDAVGEDVEHRLAHAVRGRPRAHRRPARRAAGRGTARRRSSARLGLAAGPALAVPVPAGLPLRVHEAELAGDGRAELVDQDAPPHRLDARRAPGRAAGTGRRRCGSAGSPSARGCRGSCAPRGSCPRAGRSRATRWRPAPCRAWPRSGP